MLLEFEAIGTHWVIELLGYTGSLDYIRSKILKRIDAFDKTYSRFRTDSLVTKMSQAAGVYKLPKDAKPMFDLYQNLYSISGGLVTPLIGQVLADAGYDANYSFYTKKISKTVLWDEGLSYDGTTTITIKRPVLLDFGACGKGYLVDIIGEILQTNGCGEFIVNAGGDILHRGDQSVQIALEAPNNTSTAIGVATIKNNAICGSSGNRRSWGDFNHIIDPKTQDSPRHIQAVWACAKSTMLADAMTTALYFIDANTLLKRYSFSYAVVNANGSLVYSDDFNAEFFT